MFVRLILTLVWFGLYGWLHLRVSSANVVEAGIDGDFGMHFPLNNATIWLMFTQREPSLSTRAMYRQRKRASVLRIGHLLFMFPINPWVHQSKCSSNIKWDTGYVAFKCCLSFIGIHQFMVHQPSSIESKRDSSPISATTTKETRQT